MLPAIENFLDDELDTGFVDYLSEEFKRFTENDPMYHYPDPEAKLDPETEMRIEEERRRNTENF